MTAREQSKIILREVMLKSKGMTRKEKADLITRSCPFKVSSKKHERWLDEVKNVLGCSITEYRRRFQGERYGRLVVIKDLGLLGKNKKDRKWLCQCDCGNTCEVASTNLNKGTRSCGCLARDLTIQRATTHGESRGGKTTKEFKTWMGIIQRGKDKSVAVYAGRGIKVCDRWLDSYENFLTDMGRAPSTKHSIDRIDVNGDYEPSNCRWATMKQQGNNRRNNRFIAYNGETMTISQWAEQTGIKYQTLYARILKRKWPLDVAFKPELRHPYEIVKEHRIKP